LDVPIRLILLLVTVDDDDDDDDVIIHFLYPSILFNFYPTITTAYRTAPGPTQPPI
jgi:hypothetical protein